MLFIRRSATLAVLTVLACTVTLLGDVSTAPRVSGGRSDKRCERHGRWLPVP